MNVDTINEVKKQEEYIKKVKELNQGKILKYHILTMGCQLKTLWYVGRNGIYQNR